MNDKLLRKALLRTASQLPNGDSSRRAILDLVRNADMPMGMTAKGCPTNVDDAGKCEEWDANSEKYKDVVKDKHRQALADKEAGCEKLPNEAMQKNCEDKKKEGEKNKGEDKADKKDDKAASLRSNLIRVAATLPVGSADRKALLGVLAAKKKAEYIGDGQEFANILSKKWRNVKYNDERGAGFAELGSLSIQWQESGNDDAVIVNITKTPTLKGPAGHVAKALETVRRALAGI